MGLLLKSFAGGSVEIRPNGSSNNITISIGGSGGTMVFQDSNTGIINLPSGNTAQRPTSAAGKIRFNSQTNGLEFSNGSNWITF